MPRLENISTRQILVFAALAVAATILLTSPFSIASSDINLENCQLSRNGQLYTIDSCTSGGQYFGNGNTVALAVENPRLDRFTLDTSPTGNWYLQWTDHYLQAAGFPSSQYAIQCTAGLPFDDTSRDIDFCTDNTDLADTFQNVYGGFEKTVDDVDNFQYSRVIRADGIPRRIEDGIKQSGKCTATVRVEDGTFDPVGTADLEGTIFVQRQGSTTGSFGCLITLPTRFDGERVGNGRSLVQQVSFTVDASFPDAEQVVGGDDGAGGDDNGEVSLIEQVTNWLRGLLDTVLGVFR